MSCTMDINALYRLMPTTSVHGIEKTPTIDAVFVVNEELTSTSATSIESLLCGRDDHECNLYNAALVPSDASRACVNKSRSATRIRARSSETPGTSGTKGQRLARLNDCSELQSTTRISARSTTCSTRLPKRTAIITTATPRYRPG